MVHFGIQIMFILIEKDLTNMGDTIMMKENIYQVKDGIKKIIVMKVKKEKILTIMMMKMKKDIIKIIIF